jgi:hypothetical protein
VTSQRQKINKKIYIQVSASNGYVLSRGHLLMIDRLTKKFSKHNETRDLANMKPEPKTKIIISEEVIFCESLGMMKICKLTNKWIDGHLKTIKKDCPCKD